MTSALTSSTTAKSARSISPEAAAALVRSGDWLDYGAVLGQPDAFDKALAARIGELRDVSIRACLCTRPRAVVEADPEGEHVSFYNWHLGGYDRKQCDAGLQSYIPCNLGEIPDYYRRFIDPPELMVVKTCPVDADGYFNFGAANLWHGAVASRAKVVVVEVDPAVPYVHGIDNGLHVSQVDYVIDGTGLPLPELPKAVPTDVDREVARLIATEIEDGACLQIGIGAMPDAVCSLLLDSGVRNLGIHTEMLTDGIIDLYRAGVVTGSAKTMHPGKIVCTFGLGSHVDLRRDRRQSRHLVPAGGDDELAPADRPERPNDVDQQHDPDGSPGPSGERVERSSSHQRDRRPAPVHPRRLRIERREVVPLHVVDVRAAAAYAGAASCST